MTGVTGAAWSRELRSHGSATAELEPSPGALSFFRSAQSARGSREKGGCGTGEAAQQWGLLEGEIRASLTRHPCPQTYFIIMQSVFYPPSRISER